MKKNAEAFQGNISQTPPMYSAVSVGGKRLYDLARKGIEVDRPSREITVSKFNICDFNEETGEGHIDITCSRVLTFEHSLMTWDRSLAAEQ